MFRQNYNLFQIITILFTKVFYYFCIMESLLQIENLTKSFGDCILFKNITFGVNEGDKIGLIAKNGAGKSTLLKIICDNEAYDNGKVTFRNDIKVGYLEQTPKFDPELSVIEVCMQGIDSSHEDAWEYENRFKQVLTQLKIADLNIKTGKLSGGQLKRVALAKLIIENNELLILDEPTNHLDIEIIEWLEGYLSRNKIAILMVTHDRYFLDKVCNKIIEIDQQYIYTYNGNYNYYLEKRQERIDAQNAETAKARNLLRTELEWMRRQPQARGTKAKYRIDAFYDLKEKASQRYHDKSVELNVKSAYIGSKIFEAVNISKKYNEKIILEDFNYIFARYEKVGIVGNNGVGKSTFVKLLLGLERPDSGSFDIGETVSFGYYSQEGMSFDESMKVIDAVTRIAEYIEFDEKSKYSASQFLQFFLFSPADQQKFIYKLSGGEKRRLYLATVLMKRPNFLILDEPTNDLDIITLEILEDYLSKFKGCVIIISHDRFFMDKTVDHLFVFEGNGVVKDFPGNYSNYRDWKEANEKESESKKKEVNPKRETVSRSTRPEKMSFKEKREFEALDIEIEALNKEKEEIEALFQNGASTTEIESASKRYNEIKAMLDEKELRWLELSEKA